MSEHQVEYDRLEALAKKKDWTLPATGLHGYFPRAVWARYWRQMEAAEKLEARGNVDVGRPVAPHRSGS